MNQEIINSIYFCEIEEPSQQANTQKQSNYIKLLGQNFNLVKILPRLFTINTKNGSYKFNTEMLKDTCTVISDFLKNNTNSHQYFLDLEDEENIMGKYEQLYLGSTVIFNKSEIPIACSISKKLNLINIPSYLKQDAQQLNFYRRSYSNINGIKLTDTSFENFLKNKIPKSFIIITNNKKYSCNKYGVYSSKIIRDMVEKDPTVNQYVYDFENEFDEFQLICNLFNFELIQITSNNVFSLKKIAEDLQIECILDDINNFINSYKNSTGTIDEKHQIIDEINQLFDMLYHIKEQSIENVKNLIVDSIFSQSEENVQELAAFILQVVQNDFQLQPYLAELLQELNKEANNSLKILTPFIVKHLMLSFANNKLNCSFVYLLCKRKIIDINEVVNKIISKDKYLTDEFVRADINEINDRKFHNNSIVWFFPELIEFQKINFKIKTILVHLNDDTDEFIRKYYPDNIEIFKEMRDKREPDDEITRSIRNDDVDTFQSIVNKNKINLTKESNLIPFNLFDYFIDDIKINYVNYSAACGSIKCFKYLILNHAPIDSSAMNFAIFGGNSEIIRIIDQNETQTKKYNNNNNDSQDELYQLAFYSISKHQDALFDWILEQKFLSKGITGNSLSKLVQWSAENGNIHSLIQCIDNGFDLNSFPRSFCEKLICISSENGFCRFTQFLFCLLKPKITELMRSKTENSLVRNFDYSVLFGNLSIFKLFLSIKSNHSDLEKPLLIAIENDYTSIIKYIVETLFNEKIQLSRGGMLRILGSSIKKKSTDLFLYFIDKFKLDNIMKKFDISLSDFYHFLLDGCKAGNFEAVKVITDLILQKNSKLDFTEPFIRGVVSKSFDICQFLVEKKVFLNFFKLSKESSRLTVGDEKLFNLLIEIADLETREMFFGSFLYEAIKNQNKTLVKYLLKSNVQYDCALFEAVKTHNIDIVNIILEHDSKPSFINNNSQNGTALNIAVSLNDLTIVKRLLSIQGINPNLYDRKGFTPLLSAINESLNIDMINTILDFYGEEIHMQIWQLNEALKNILKRLTSMSRCDETQKIKDEKIKIYNVINRFVQIKDLNLNQPVGKQTLLSCACEINELNLVKILLKSESINVNSCQVFNGNTPLMAAIENNNIKIAEFLIDLPQTNINLRNFEQQTALTIAVKKRLKDVVSLLINNKKFDANESRLNYAFFISKGEISQQLISVKNLDVNYKFETVIDSYQKVEYDDKDFYSYYVSKIENSKKLSNSFETTLMKAVSENNIEMVEMIIKHQSFNPVKSLLKTSIFIAANKNEGEIFKMLLKLMNNDVNIFDQNGNSLLISSSMSCSQEIVTRIVNNEKFDPIKSDLYKAFMKSSFIDEDSIINELNEVNINIMNTICKYDQEHLHLIDFGHLLPNGNSFFTSIDSNIKNIGSLASFYLEHGVDVNMPDEHGIYPLEYAIGINSLEFASTLLKSGRIDFSIRFKNNHFSLNKIDQTYLHLAARCNNEKILKELIDSKMIDINATDELGETPLMEACKYNKIRNIRLFFQYDDLDYLYCNNSGDDAIHVAQKCFNCFNYKKIKRNDQNDTKENYLTNLLSTINYSINNFNK